MKVLKGTCHIRDMTDQKWEKGCELLGRTGQRLAAAPRSDVKEVLLAFIEDHARQRMAAESS